MQLLSLNQIFDYRYLICLWLLNDITMQMGGDEMVYTSKAIEKETERQDVRCLYEELLKNATTEQKEKAYIAATAFLLGAQQKTA